MVNTRRLSLSQDPATPGSPFKMKLSSEAPEGYMSDLDIHDEEFAAEEQAHRSE